MRKIGLLIFLLSYGLGAYAAQSPSDDMRGCSNAGDLKDIRISLTRIQQDLDCIEEQLADLDCSNASIEFLIEQAAEITSKIALLAESSGCCDQVSVLLSVVESIDSKIEHIPLSSCCEQIADSLNRIITIENQLIDLNGDDCCSLIEAIISRIPSIESRVAGLDIPDAVCTKTRVTGVTTINSSGYYCLANNIEGVAGTFAAITIDAENVILDLNGYTLTVNGNQDPTAPEGININRSNVFVRNGIITSAGDFDPISHGDAIRTAISTNIRIEDILIQDTYNFALGIALLANNCVVENVHISGCKVDGLQIISGGNNFVRNCSFNNNGKHGLNIFGSSNNTVQNCTANFNNVGPIPQSHSFIDMVGFLVENRLSGDITIPSNNNMFISCNAGGHVETFTEIGAGFRIGNIGDETMMPTPSNAGMGNVILSCVSQGNNIGIDIIESDGSQLVKDSVVVNNDTAGFRHSPNLASSSISLIEYLNNAALANPINYDDPSDPAYNGPIVPYESLTPALDLYWGNVELL